MTAYLNALGLLCALGSGKQEVAERLFAGDASGLRWQDGWVPERRLPVGAITTSLPELPGASTAQATRNNQLLMAAALQIDTDIQQAIARYGRARIGVILGTSTSGIHEATQGIASYLRGGEFPASYHYGQQELAAPAAFLADWLQLSGPAYVISTACTSSARALLSARRLLDSGTCDAVLCGGVDSLCQLTLNGFNSLEALASERCNPFSRNRSGINIGEAAVLFLMTREPLSQTAAPIALLGAAASSDAHHISAPDPEGRGAQQVMRAALTDAGLAAEQIAYLNLHGTATRHNDAMESLAVAALFPAGVPCSSTKPLTGHTLGAAGALEAAFCWLSLAAENREQRVPPHLWDAEADPQLPALHLTNTETRLTGAAPLRMMSNSFAFGGSNISLVLGHPKDWVRVRESVASEGQARQKQARTRSLLAVNEQSEPVFNAASRAQPAVVFTQPDIWPIAELLPHAGDMILLDRVLSFGEEEVRTELTVRAGGLFSQADGSLPAWVGVELMAQSIAAYAGCQARQAGAPVELGFLLGTRSFQCNVEAFPLGAQLQIHAIRSLQDDNGMGVFECHLNGPGIHAEARLNVFRPPHVASYLEEPAHD